MSREGITFKNNDTSYDQHGRVDFIVDFSLQLRHFTLSLHVCFRFYMFSSFVFKSQLGFEM